MDKFIILPLQLRVVFGSKNVSFKIEIISELIDFKNL